MEKKPFKRKPKVITFPEGHELEGLEVIARRPTVRAIEAVTEIEAEAGEATVARQVFAIIDSLFAPALITWNYRDEADEPVPPTAEGLRDIDVEALLFILTAWTGDQDIPADLGKGSDSGHSSPARLLDGVPTVTNPELSSALLNLPAHSVS